MWSKLTCLTLLFALANCNYNGYKVFQTEDIHSQSKAIELIKFIESADEGVYDFWVSPRVGSYAKVMVAPGHVSEFEKFLKEKSIASTLLIEDVEITNQRAFIVENILRKFKTSSRSIDFENYYSSDDIFAYLHELEADNDFVEVETYGKSYEGRDLKVIKILKAGPNAPNIFIEAGIHAREWIAPAMGTYIIHSLLEDPENARYLDQFNFHIMPSVNPDGYEYSREYERLWRKTRSRNQETSCRGVDPNRNWGYHWNETSVSNNPCSDIFPGLKPFSELETDAIRQYVEKLQSTPLMSLSLHSAANLWLVPYGYAYNVYPENYDELMGLAEKAVDALNAVHYAGFEAINSANLYPASGASDDWYLGVLGSTYAYTVELRQGGNLGFDLPPSEIKESGEELWAGMKVIFDRLHEVSSQ